MFEVVANIVKDFERQSVHHGRGGFVSDLQVCVARVEAVMHGLFSTKKE